MKIIGLMVTWNNLEFLKCSLPQALSFCDELILVEGCHSQRYLKRSTDGTCEYIETIKGLPKLRVRDFSFKGNYLSVQRTIRSEFPKISEFYKQGNWVFNWDDDCLFMKEELSMLRMAMEMTEYDSVSYAVRNFIYNFRFNSIEMGAVDAYRIIDGMYLTGIDNAHYKDGRRFPFHHIDDITLFHYNYVKKPERFKARMAMSVEKGTEASIGVHEKWMGVKWDKDEDIFKSRAVVESVRPGEELNIYNGKHPEAVDNHPWRYIKDVREIK